MISSENETIHEGTAKRFGSMATIAVILAVALLGCGNEDTGKAYPGSSVDSVGMRTRETIIPESAQIDTVRLRELLVIGGQGAPIDNLLTTAYEPIAAGPGFEVAVLHRRPMGVRVFNTEGELVGHLGRRGEGPGEYNYLRGVVFEPTLGWIVTAIMPGRILTYDESFSICETVSSQELFSRYGGTWSEWRHPLFIPGGRRFWFLGVKSALEKPMRTEGDFDDFTVAIVDWATLESRVVFRFSQPAQVFRDPEYPGAGARYPYAPLCAQVDGDGRLWLNWDFPYEINILTVDGNSLQRLRGDYELREYPRDYRMEIESTSTVHFAGEYKSRRLPPHRPAIGSMTWTGSQTMWVFHHRLPAEKWVQVDTYTGSGDYLASFIAPYSLVDCPIGVDTIWTRRTAEDGAPELVLYEYAVPGEG